MGSFLRSLSPSAQVGLLFVLLFGLLALASIGFLFWLLREPRQETADRLQARQRLQEDLRVLLRSSWIMAVVFWVAWALGDGMATLLFAMVSFLILREFISLSPTRRGDHRSLLLAFFAILPFQYVLVWSRHFDLFTVFIPVYAFLGVAVVSAFGNDPQRFLERNAKLQWGIMVCVYGMSHVPALMMIEAPRLAGREAFLVFFLVLVVQTCMLVQHLSARGQQHPALPGISTGFGWRSWGWGLMAGGLLGVALAGLTPFKPLMALLMALLACAAGSFGHLVMKAIKRDRGVTSWGSASRSVTGASGLLDRTDALCFAAPVFFHAVRWSLQT
ncbi:MAG TPA: phosphatidate cytidylyltransferase [Hydrogenophaga sp.]|uniref:phosphatidate cytidylyltransferase n=1 Tax=Hydrogenophaga sp. TaxID=1904254 RepID=UPI002CFE775F|nr:phosphatidate cytidylyltransferase [Hydrogenophaga sp.]HMN93486.1 phosphatidate cytidylyltransferase [Hydrogenophaga sp.]HMP09643.1 phosphatidate cytidylyltransferase [Hydrogenophaga sp.]